MLSRALLTSARGLRPMSAAAGLERTALFDVHTELGAKMVPFAGFEMPVQYDLGVKKEHNHTRAQGCSSLFDVSHMGQLRIEGADRVAFLERVVVGDIEGLAPGTGRLSLICNEQGGIIDDCVVNNAGDHIYMVVNAGNKDEDWEHMSALLSEFGGDVRMSKMEDRSLVALQGPGAAAHLAALTPIDLPALHFMSALRAPVAGVPDCIVTRCGYTGEDGFEISIPSDSVADVARAMLAVDGVAPCGLGARDSLRLEAGLCLHGHDITQETLPFEAGLAWTIAKRRREDKRFVGAEAVVGQIKDKTHTRKRVGVVVQGAPAREGAEVYSEDGSKKIGVLTSGTMSPTLGHPVAMGYVSKGFSKVGRAVSVERRGKMLPATIASMPFTEARYYKPE